MDTNKRKRFGRSPFQSYWHVHLESWTWLCSVPKGGSGDTVYLDPMFIWLVGVDLLLEARCDTTERASVLLLVVSCSLVIPEVVSVLKVLFTFVTFRFSAPPWRIVARIIFGWCHSDFEFKISPYILG